MRVPVAVVCLLFVASAAPFPASGDESLDALAESHQWFSLRRAIEHRTAPPYIRGLVAAAFNDASGAEKYLRAALDRGLDADHAYAAHQALFEMYVRNGHYPKAVVEAKQTWRFRPPGDSEKNMMAQTGRMPEMTVASRKPGSATYTLWDDVILLLPVTINGGSANFILDTDSNISVISRSEATRLGLVEEQGSLDVSGINGESAPGAQLTIAKTLTIGGTTLHKVPFMILRDDQYPFVEMPEGRRGVIGLPVLLALRTIHWSRAGRVDFGSPSHGPVAGATPLAFNGMDPIAEIEIEAHQLPVVFDTGNDQTMGWPKLATDYPELLKDSKKATDEVLGYSGAGKFETAVVPSLRWTIGGVPTVLKDAAVYTQSSAPAHWYYGRLGADLLSQASEVTIDFQRMELHLRRDSR